jgi:hypothetical protein
MMVAFLVFAVNPGIGCRSEEFEFGEAEMRRAVEGRWQATIAGEAAVDLVLGSESAGLQQQHCQQRQFVRDAGACATVTTLGVVGRVTAGPASYRDLAVAGSFMAFGLTYQGGVLRLRIGPASDSPTLEGRLNDRNEVTSAALMRGGERISVVLSRLP